MFGLFGSSGKKIRTFTPAELSDYLRDIGGDCVLVDVREDNEWAGEHIPGAIHVPLSRFAEGVATIPKDKSVVFYCQSGVRSRRALDMARTQGLSAEGHLGGGISAWRGAGLPTIR